MLLRECSKAFKKRLSALYPLEEVNSIFRLCLEHVSGLPYISFVGSQVALKARDEQELLDILERLSQGEPVQYVIGKAQFAGLSLDVDPAVLIPRPETEELVEWISKEHSSGKILDIGTGSGAIALALKSLITQAEITAIDISSNALAVAKRNALNTGLEIRILEKDALNLMEDSARIEGQNVVVSNPPYVPLSRKASLHKNVRDYEPSIALFSPDHDPIIFYKNIAKWAWTKGVLAGGWLYFEIDHLYGEEIIAQLKELGFSSVELKKDIEGQPRMIRAQKN